MAAALEDSMGEERPTGSEVGDAPNTKQSKLGELCALFRSEVESSNSKTWRIRVRTPRAEENNAVSSRGEDVLVKHTASRPPFVRSECEESADDHSLQTPRAHAMSRAVFELNVITCR